MLNHGAFDLIYPEMNKLIYKHETIAEQEKYSGIFLAQIYLFVVLY